MNTLEMKIYDENLFLQIKLNEALKFFGKWCLDVKINKNNKKKSGGSKLKFFIRHTLIYLQKLK